MDKLKILYASIKPTFKTWTKKKGKTMLHQQSLILTSGEIRSGFGALLNFCISSFFVSDNKPVTPDPVSRQHQFIIFVLEDLFFLQRFGWLSVYSKMTYVLKNFPSRAAVWHPAEKKPNQKPNNKSAQMVQVFVLS